MKWLPATLGDLLVLDYGKALPRYARDESGEILVAGSNGEDGHHNTPLVAGPGIVVGRKGSAGKVTWFDSDFWPIDTTYFVRHDEKLTNLRWLYYFLIFQKLERLNKTTGVPGLNRNDVYNQPCNVPPISEQTRIVELLDKVDRLRKLRRDADAKAARILPTLFLKMFGDPSTNPMGWPTERLDRLFDVIGGGTPSKANPDYWKGNIPWVSPKDMKRDVIVDTEDHITEAAIAGSATRRVRKGTVLIVYRSGILAHTFPVAIAGRELTINQDLKAITSKTDMLNEYLYGWLIAAEGLTLGCVKKGATVHNINGSRFLALLVTMPPPNLQREFSVKFSLLLNMKEAREQASKKIDSLFDLCLQRAFDGRLTTKWRQAHMDELLTEIEAQTRILDLRIRKNLEINL